MLPDVAILLLAAGASSRWGKPKALLNWGGVPLVEHLARIALAAAGGPVVRVLGAHSAEITAGAANPGVSDVFNAEWARGMGTSIGCGLREALRLSPNLAGVVVLPCDLPLVTSAHLRLCMDAVLADPAQLVNSDYGEGAFGPPSAFGRVYFSELLALEGDEGGRHIIRRHRERLISLLFPDGRWDLDSAADLANLQNHLG